MSREEWRSIVGAASIPIEQSCEDSRFGTVVRALWPDKPALNLAQRMGVTERNALQIIKGERRVTARAIHVVNAEMLK